MSTLRSSRTVAGTVERLVREIGHVSDDDPDFHRAAELFDAGYLDSLGVVTLTALIEQELDVVLTEEDLFDPRFATVAGIVQIITARHHTFELPTA